MCFALSLELSGQLLSMISVGLAWARTLARPHSILAGSVPAEKVGVSVGIFNLLIPERLVSLGPGWVMSHQLRNHRQAAAVTGGAFLIIAALLMCRLYGNLTGA